jgi:hypothetical protein
MAESVHNRLVDDGSDVANVLQELAVLALASMSIRSAITQ